MRVSTFGNITKIGDLNCSGLFIEGEAGENIAVRDVCYVKASDQKLYQLDTGISEVDSCIAVMALETLTTGQTGRFMLSGSIEYASWSFTTGNRIIVPASVGTVSEEAEP